MSTAAQVLNLVALVDELLDHVQHTEDTTWSPTREAIAAVAERATLATGRPAVTPRPQRSQPRKRTVRAPGLLTQLEDLHAAALAAAGDSGGTRSTPTSRTPPGSQAVELLADLQADVAAALLDLAPDAPPRSSTRAALRAIVGVAGDLDDDTLTAVVRRAGSWVRTARIALTWDVPVATIQGSICPNCEAPNTLRVRADASSDVWCSGHLIGPPELGETYPRPCGERWPRHRWPALLEDIQRAKEAS